MTFGELKTLTSTWLDDLNMTYFTTAQLGVWLNNAQQEVQKQLLDAGQNWYLKVVETTMVVNQPDYELPSDFMKSHRIEVITAGTFPAETTQPLKPITPGQIDLFPLASNGTPMCFFFKKYKLIVYPAPDVANVMRLYYSPLVGAMVNANDEPDCPPEFHEYIAVLATIDGLLRDRRDPSPFIEKRTKYEDLLKKDAAQRAEDSPRSVVITTDDGFGSLF